jgi:hypothetical protein
MRAKTESRVRKLGREPVIEGSTEFTITASSEVAGKGIWRNSTWLVERRLGQCQPEGATACGPCATKHMIFGLCEQGSIVQDRQGDIALLFDHRLGKALHEQGCGDT